MPLKNTKRTGHLPILAASCALAIALAGCNSQTTGATREPLTTGSIAAQGGNKLATNTKWARAYQRNPDNQLAALNYARQLRTQGALAQAITVLTRAGKKHPKNQQLMAEYGKTLAASGKHDKALKTLAFALKLGKPDWRIYSAMGVTLDQLGQHQKAQVKYASAVMLAPAEPSLLNNMGLSFALGGDLKKAVKTLKRAAKLPHARPKIQQNLALVLGLQGKFKEADKLAVKDLPVNGAKSNAKTLRNMIAQPASRSKMKKNGPDLKHVATRTARPQNRKARHDFSKRAAKKAHNKYLIKATADETPVKKLGLRTH